MIRQPISLQTQWLLGIAAIIVAIFAYSWLSYRQHVKNPKDTTIPNASQLLEGAKKIVTPDSSDDIWLAVDGWASFKRLALGILIGVAAAFFVGIAMGCFPPVESFLLPPVSFFARIPPTAMLAVYFVIFGTEMKLFVAMIALGIFPTLAQAIYQAAKNDVTDHAVFKAYTLGSSHSEVIWEVVFRQILPRIIENIRLQIGPAMVFLIAAEWMMADIGFGYRLRMQSRLLNMNVVYIYLFILGMAGFVFDWALSFARRKLCPWFGE